MTRIAATLIVLAVIGCSSQGDASSSDPVCPIGRLPTHGTPCDQTRMDDYAYCRLNQCAWGCEDECICKEGAWFCAGSCRDDYGCGNTPMCTDKCPAH